MKIFFTLLIFYTCLSYATDESINCIDGKIRYTENKKIIILLDRYCFDTVLKTISSTKKCPNGCIVDSANPIKIKHSELNIKSESPVFEICRKANGVPQIIEYWANRVWIPTTRCLFSDGSYQDIDRLILSRVTYED